MDEQRKVKGIWIPIEVWKNKNLSWNEKILLMEIDSYTSENEDCYFSNKYISELLGVNETTANKLLSNLIKQGFVTKTRFDGRNRYVRTNISFCTKQPCTFSQPCLAAECNPANILYNNNNNYISNKKDNKEKKDKEKSLSKKDATDELFEQCWLAYKRKGSKKSSKAYWDKLSNDEKQKVLSHIKAYTSSRELQFQKDFERYLRDKIFTTVVFKDNRVIFDPTKNENGTPYTPMCDGAISWNDYYNCYILVGMYYGKVFDGYTDDNRPNGAKIMLGNGGGFIVWNKETKTWDKINN